MINKTTAVKVRVRKKEPKVFEESIVIGCRMHRSNLKKLDDLAEKLQVSRNRVLSILVEAAEITNVQPANVNDEVKSA